MIGSLKLIDRCFEIIKSLYNFIKAIVFIKIFYLGDKLITPIDILLVPQHNLLD